MANAAMIVASLANFIGGLYRDAPLSPPQLTGWHSVPLEGSAPDAGYAPPHSVKWTNLSVICRDGEERGGVDMARTSSDTWAVATNGEPATTEIPVVPAPTPAPSPRKRPERKKARVTPVLK